MASTDDFFESRVQETGVFDERTCQSPPSAHKLHIMQTWTPY
jgi:hypothetical protein